MTFETMKITDNETQWAKIGQIGNIAFVGKETIMFGVGCHLVFINLNTNEEYIYTANNCEVGDGIKCFVGHRTQPIFAFADNRTNPTIFIKTIPNFEEICVFKNETPRSYIAMAFSETSLFIALGDLPDFKLNIWNWRRGELLACQETKMLISKQMLKCSLSSPVILAQMGIHSNKMLTWDILICGKQCALTKHIINTPPNCAPYQSVLWTTEGGLFVLDSVGCVYAMLPNHSLEKVIECSQTSGMVPSFAWYKSGIVVAGPDNQIRHFKKSGTWTVDWSMEPPEPISRLFSRSEFLIATTINSNILQAVVTQNTFKYIKKNESHFNDFCIIYPTGNYIVALCYQNILNLYEISTGILKHSFELKNKALTLTENPKFPYVAVGCSNGTMELISAYNPEKLVKMTHFCLSKMPIDDIFFNECGTIFIAASLSIGRLFVIEGLPGGKMEILANIDSRYQIASYMLAVSEDCYRIYAIPVTSDRYIAGNIIIRYCVIKGKQINVKEYVFDNENVLNARLYPTSGINRDRKFYAIPFEGKTINELEVKRGCDEVKLLRKIVTGHQMRNVHLKRNNQYALTWAYDGFVILRSSDFAEGIAIALPHHRMKCGVRKASVDPYQKYIISLGWDNVLVCTNLLQTEIDPQLREENEELMTSSTFRLLFTNRTVGFVPKGEYEGKCYLEIQELKKIDHERVQCLTERNKILAEFKSIQTELQKLLTENIEGPDNEKLELEEFNLNTQLFQQKSLHHKLLCQATEDYLRNLISAQDCISQFMVENYWNKMKIPGTAIKAIFARFEVNNYVLLPENMQIEEVLNWIRHQRKIERHLNNSSAFHPWVPIPEKELIEMMSARPSLPEKDKEMTIVLSNLDVDPGTEEVNEACEETKIAFSGSDLARFIEVQDAHYIQNELQTYYQAELQWTISKSDLYKLKEYFNTKFDNTMTQKLKEMSNITEKNNRLRHIVSELNYFSEKKFNIRIDDPQWDQRENPKLITEVKDEEVPITPYISPSEQAILDAQAAEAERIRLLLLADDFRERALMAMMNGVLEVRWEDELKKDVPKPKCMLEKEPEQFNEDDLRTVRDYEEKVKFLNSERERYKHMLNSEYAKVSHSVRENIRKFNGKLGDLLHLKLLVDSAISQESLKIIRAKLFQRTRSLFFKKENDILQKISENENVMHHLQKLLSLLHESLTECRNYAEAFALKEKMLERAFKKDFQDAQTVIQEQINKLYKKRPKINIRGLNSSTILNELSKYILQPNVKPPPILNQESIDFLKALDNLDLYVGVPSIIEEHTYNLVCKHRRLKIEYEIKLRSAQLALAEAEATVTIFHKKIASKKERAANLGAHLAEVRSAFIRLVSNSEIQIVIPRGLVEIPLTGSFDDFEDAVLICRKDVQNINEIILEFGDKKLKSLQQTIGFHRKILAVEWEHKKMKMQIQDLNEKLVDIEGVRLTKEIQFFLKFRDKEKTIPFETEVDMIKASYENTIQDRKDHVNRMRKQIKSIRAHDKIIDKKIQERNVDVCEFNLKKDQELDDKERAMIDARMKILIKRSKLVKQIQDNHHEILVLQTELELLRLKTFPTLKYKLCN